LKIENSVSAVRGLNTGMGPCVVIYVPVLLERGWP